MPMIIIGVGGKSVRPSDANAIRKNCLKRCTRLVQSLSHGQRGRTRSANGMVRPCSCPASKRSWQGGAKDKEHAMSQTPNTAIAVIGIDIGKNSFHVVGHDARGAI